MKPMNSADRLRIMNCIPRNMAQLHGEDNISEFVLHNICCQSCFNLHKAAYFVDNPAFNCLKGVAGYDKQEDCHDPAYIWRDKESFSRYMQNSQFNQKVRSCAQYSCKNCETPDEEIIKVIATDLGMNNFRYCSWDMRHDNHGYLIYESNGPDIEVEELLNGLSLLNFCPIF